MYLINVQTKGQKMGNSDNSLKLIQDTNLKILCEVKKICKNNNITAFIDSGTLLGAIRHKDFIPWDDDIDMTIKRTDYKKFVNALKKELPEWLEFVDYKDYNGLFFDFVSRVEVKNSQLRNPQKEDLAYSNKQNKISLDIFILDNAPDNKLMHKLQILQQFLIYGLAMGHRYKIDYSKYSSIQGVIIKMLSKIGRRVSIEKIYRMQYKASTKYNKKDTSYYMASNYILKEIGIRYRKEWFEKSEKKFIRDEEFDVPNGWDNILTKMYGNYMELPPEEDRVYIHMNNGELIIGKTGE